MTWAELYERLEIPAAVIEKLDACGDLLQSEWVEPYLKGMMAGETAKETYEALEARLQEDKGSFKMLLCQLECARRCHAEYRAKGISDAVFADTMKCFRRYLLECERKTGEMYFDRGWWTYRQISMRLFRIGELEYELHSIGDEKLVHLHIPSDAAFTRENVDESLKQAARFIERYYPDYAQAKRVCDSWLLSPQLQRILPPSSNILDFQRRFTILKVDAEGREYMEWIFQAPKDAEPSGLSEKTSLQRAAKKLLLAGGNIGAAYGMLK